MDLWLAGKVAVVTGASRRTDQSIARALTAEGAHVVLAAPTSAQLDVVADSCANEWLACAIDLRWHKP